MPDALIAEKHSREYLIHKYWSRKPANVVRALLRKYTRPGDTVLDPFCGSGVSLIEALKLGRRAIGVDLNPAAVLLARVATRQHDLAALRRQWESILDVWKPACLKAYRTADGRQVNYCVHASLIDCPACGAVTRGDECPKSGNRYRCPRCGQRLLTNIAHARGTRVIGVRVGSGDLLIDPDLLEHQTDMSGRLCCAKPVAGRYDVPLLHNARILAYPGMTTSTLFTPRNFSLLASFADFIHEADCSEPIRDALLLGFTSAVASCSRLIAFRNNMKGGGPAWTVPGFWVPPLHIERCPLGHLTVRFKKLEKGLAELARQMRSPRATIYLDDGASRLADLRKRGTKVQYLFVDPPYGDSVPFLEFSQIWNCWDRRADARFEREVVVSDRSERKTCWEEYRQRLAAVLKQCGRVLAPGGHLTVTFNNLEIRAWHALLSVLQATGFRCKHVMYQIPAVVSAKAGFAPTSSYVGDVYATFRRSPQSAAYQSWTIVDRRLKEASRLRAGAVGRVTQLKAAALTILAENAAADCFLELDRRLAGLPAKTPPIPPHSRLHDMIRRAIGRAFRQTERLTDAQLCAAVVRCLPNWTALDRHEILRVAADAGLARSAGAWRLTARRPPPS